MTANCNRPCLFKRKRPSIVRADLSRAWFLGKGDQVARVRTNQYRDAQVNRLIDVTTMKLRPKKRYEQAKPLYLRTKYFEMYILFRKTKLYEKILPCEIYYFQAKDWDQRQNYKRVVELDKNEIFLGCCLFKTVSSK